MSHGHDGWMEAVLEVARRAGAIALASFIEIPLARGRGLAVDRKHDGSPVTEADRAAERAARAWIEEHFPGDGILGEEHGTVRPEAARRWLIDPIDGTKSYVRGVPLWGSLVAVTEGERVHAGAAVFPALGESIVAAPGRGCWWNDARCAVSAVADLPGATVLTTDERFAEHADRRAGWRRLAEGAAVSRTWGDCYGYLLVATGRAEVMVDGVLSPWDTAPLIPIIEEAGGVFTDWEGRGGFSGGSAIATNLGVAEAARRALGCPVTARPGAPKGAS